MKTFEELANQFVGHYQAMSKLDVAMIDFLREIGGNITNPAERYKQYLEKLGLKILINESKIQCRYLNYFYFISMNLVKDSEKKELIHESAYVWSINFGYYKKEYSRFVEKYVEVETIIKNGVFFLDHLGNLSTDISGRFSSNPEPKIVRLLRTLFEIILENDNPYIPIKANGVI